MLKNACAADIVSDEISFLGLSTWIRADRERTGGTLSMIEQVIPAGFELPWHVHHTEDELFYVIDGAVTVIVDGATVALGAGGYAFGPRGVPHGFRVEGDRPARILLMKSCARLSPRRPALRRPHLHPSGAPRIHRRLLPGLRPTQVPLPATAGPRAARARPGALRCNIRRPRHP